MVGNSLIVVGYGSASQEACVIGLTLLMARYGPAIELEFSVHWQLQEDASNFNFREYDPRYCLFTLDGPYVCCF